MNWKTIARIYRCILIYNNTIEYHGSNKYSLTVCYPSGEKYCKTYYKGTKIHGKYIVWNKNGFIRGELDYKNGKII